MMMMMTMFLNKRQSHSFYSKENTSIYSLFFLLFTLPFLHQPVKNSYDESVKKKEERERENEEEKF